LKLGWRQRVEYVRQKLSRKKNPQSAEPPTTALTQIADATIRAVRAYYPSVYPGFIHLFRASQDVKRRDLCRVQTWAKYAGLGQKVLVGQDGCDGSNILLEPFVGATAKYLKHALEQVNAAPESGHPSIHLVHRIDTRATAAQSKG
jgi:hypothetical protein